jgi:hypothetical protein
MKKTNQTTSNQNIFPPPATNSQHHHTPQKTVASQSGRKDKSLVFTKQEKNKKLIDKAFLAQIPPCGAWLGRASFNMDSGFPELIGPMPFVTLIQSDGIGAFVGRPYNQGRIPLAQVIQHGKQSQKGYPGAQYGLFPDAAHPRYMAGQQTGIPGNGSCGNPEVGFGKHTEGLIEQPGGDVYIPDFREIRCLHYEAF